jgi:hypothetical protein
MILSSLLPYTWHNPSGFHRTWPGGLIIESLTEVIRCDLDNDHGPWSMVHSYIDGRTFVMTFCFEAYSSTVEITFRLLFSRYSRQVQWIILVDMLNSCW